MYALTAYPQDQTILMWLPSPKLKIELFLVIQFLKFWLTKILFFNKKINLAKIKITFVYSIRIWQSDYRFDGTRQRRIR